MGRFALVKFFFDELSISLGERLNIPDGLRVSRFGTTAGSLWLMGA